MAMDMQEYANMSEERTSTLDYENGKYKCEKYVPVSLSSIKIIKPNNFCTWISIHLECGGFIIITFRLFILDYHLDYQQII